MLHRQRPATAVSNMGEQVEVYLSVRKAPGACHPTGISQAAAKPAAAYNSGKMHSSSSLPPLQQQTHLAVAS
jgi:hypothetical protein